MMYLPAISIDSLFKMVPDKQEELPILISEDFFETDTIKRTIRNTKKSAGCRIGMDHSMIRPYHHDAIRRFFKDGMQIMIRTQIPAQRLCIPFCC